MKQKTTPELRFPEFTGDWEEKGFREIFKFSTGKNIKQSEASPNFATPCVRYGELYHLYNEVIYKIINATNLDKSTLRFSKGGEILIPSAGEDPLDIGSASALPFKNIAIGRTINILSPSIEGVYSATFVSFYINQKLKRKIATLAKGFSISNVYNSDLKQLQISLPTLKEQQKIAEFLTAVDKRIQTLEKKKNLLEAYKKGVMQKIFNQEIRFKDDNDNDFPDWEKKRLSSIGQPFTGLKSKTKEDFGKGKPYIQYKQIFDDSVINLSECGYVNIKEDENQNLVKFGDILFTVSSETPEEIGFSSVFLEKDIDVYLNSFCFGFRIKSFQTLNPEFSHYLFRSQGVRKDIIKLGQGSTRFNMSKKEFIKIEINVPNEEEQKKIANFLSAIDQKIKAVEDKLTHTQAYKKGLLQRMFV